MDDKQDGSPDYQFEYIESAGPLNTGGGIMVDMLYLKDGTIVGISDELIVLYPSEDAFWGGTEKHLGLIPRPTPGPQDAPGES